VAHTGVMEEIRRRRRHEEARDKRKSKARTLEVLPELTQLALEEGFVYPWTIRFLHVHTSFPLKIPCIYLQLLCVKCQIAALPCHGASVEL